MMIVTEGSTDVTTYFHLRLAADGTDATALTITNIDLQYTRSGVAPTAKVDATALAATDSAHGDNQAIEVDATDQPGLYRVDWPDAAFAAGVREVLLTVKVATAFTETLRVQIVSATRGLAGTALPAAAADAAGGLPISDAGGLDMDAQRTDVAAILVDTGTTLQAELDGIQADTEDIQTRLPAALVSGRIDASVGAMAADVMTAAAAAADLTTELQNGLATAAALATVDGIVDAILLDTAEIGAAGAGLTAVPWNADWDAQVQSEVQDALEVNNLDHIAGTAASIPAIPAGTFLDQIMDDGTATYDRTTDSLQAIRDRGDAEWTTATGFSTHSAADVWAVATRVLTAGTNLNNLSEAQVLTQVNAAIDTAIAELGVGAPTATPTLRTGLMLLYMAIRNATTSTATETTISNNAGTVIATAPQSDDGSTYEKGEFA